MVGIEENIARIRRQIPSSVRLIAVSKTVAVEDIQTAYNTGQRDFGENRVQELLMKKDELPGDIKWHLIGHLQTNKVKYIAPFISMIHSVDSFRLLSAIDREAGRAGRIINCLLQIHIADETTKFGFFPEEVMTMIGNEDPLQFQNILICGVMGMATFTDDHAKVRKEFSKLRKCYSDLKEKYFVGQQSFSEISMGMSGDYRLAIEEGSTMIRIGSNIFGERNKIF